MDETKHWWQSTKKDAQDKADQMSRDAENAVNERTDKAKDMWQSTENEAYQMSRDAENVINNSSEQAKHWWSSTKQDAQQSMDNAARDARSSVDAAAEDARGTARSWRDSFDQKVNELNDRAVSGTERLQERLHHWSDEAHNKFDDMSQRTHDMANETADKAKKASSTMMSSSTAQRSASTSSNDASDRKWISDSEWERLYAEARTMVQDAEEDLERAQRMQRHLEQVRSSA
ncbi:hypothetical protein BC940DRAFT_299178 [Gongronella butleri]|nr:hypothetical protein BC940DRAFT_299178 [Gongronella butleri]